MHQKDLADFHKSVFGYEPPAESLPTCNTDPEASSELYADPDDNLGYYPDGVKRTLTDEQIAIFRHSEVYKLIRQRELARERQSDESRAPGDNDNDAITITGNEGAETTQPKASKNKRRKLKKSSQKPNERDDNLPSRRQIRELDANPGDGNEALDYD